MTAFIALPKGELAGDVENYLAKLGINVNVTGKPLLTQSVGQTTYRIVNTRDVPRFVGRSSIPSYDFGISGFDYCLDESLKPIREGNFAFLMALDFGKGDLVIYSKSKNVKKNPVIVIPKDIENLGRKYMDDLFGVGWKPLLVNGATEGYVSSGEADLGFDLMSDKNTNPEYIGTIKRNGLVVLEKLMPTRAVLIGKASYTPDDFFKALKTK